jgi:hypothetical protein
LHQDPNERVSYELTKPQLLSSRCGSIILTGLVLTMGLNTGSCLNTVCDCCLSLHSALMCCGCFGTLHRRLVRSVVRRKYG